MDASRGIRSSAAAQAVDFKGRRRTLRMALLPAIVLLFLLLPAVAQAGQVSITLDRIFTLNCSDDFPETCPQDYYAKVFIDGQDAGRIPSAGGFSGGQEFSPAWRFTANVHDDLEFVPVTVLLNDHDDGPGDDDEIDISSGAHKYAELLVEQATGFVAGMRRKDGETHGSGADSAQVFFTFDTSLSHDIDGDGLPDGVERQGYRDGFGPYTHLNAMGADPCRKTIALEIDWLATPAHNHRPNPAAITEIQNAFDNAPVDATTPCPYVGYPRKPKGVDLVVDLSDQIDHDNPGGANFEPNVNLGGTNGAADFELYRALYFPVNRRPYFHYVLFAHDLSAGDTTSGVCCDKGDLIVSLGSWTGSVGTAREQSGTLMHELGHALGLDHGGDSGINHKPNYFSVMNYQFQRGIFDADPLTADAGIIDYSTSVLPPITETNLSELAPGLNGANPPRYTTVWSLANGGTASAAEFGAINWNDDRTAPGGPPDLTDTGLTQNVNDFTACIEEGPNGTLETAAAAGDVTSGVRIYQGTDDDCDTTKPAGNDDVQKLPPGFTSLETAIGRRLTGFEDWSRLNYAGSIGGGGSSPAPQSELTVTDAREIARRQEEANDGKFQISLGDATVGEGASGTKTLSLPLTLNASRPTPIEVDYTLTGGPDAAATVPGDFAAPTTGTVTFAANTTTATVDLKVAGDTVDEAKEEHGTVTLSNPKHAVVLDGTGVATIVDDDRDGDFACRGIGLQVGTQKFADTAAAGVRCADATRSHIVKQKWFGMTNVTANIFNAATDQTPDDLTAAPATGDRATANTSATAVRIVHGLTTINATTFEAGARAECTGTGPPTFTTTSRVLSLTVNGKPLVTVNGTATIPLLGLTIRLNEQTATAREIVRRAIVFDYWFLPDVIVSEARAGYGGTAAHPNGDPCVA